MEDIHSWSGGLDKDITKSLLPKNKYRDARNMRLTTNKGGGGGGIENILGNTLFKQIPDTWQVYKLTWVSSNNTTITVNGQTTASLASGATALDDTTIYNAIIGLSNYNVSFGAAHQNGYIIIWGLTQNPVITFGTGGVILSTLYVAAQSNLEVIGYAVLRDIEVWFTTNVTNTTGGVGQIWSVTYKKNKLISSPSTAATFTLLYNNDIKFTKAHPFPKDGGTVPRYENALINRVYWTDNFNPLRSFNIADPQGFAVDPTILDVVSSIDKSIPILKIINDSGGVVKTSQYFLSYQLGSVGGAVTSFTPLSNGVKIINTLSSAAFRDQFGTNSGSGSTKSITWTISNIDTDYDRIKIAIIRCDDVNNPVPTSIDIVADEPVPSDGNMDFTYTDNETKIPLTLDEFLALSSTFNRCKAIATKDNRLFAANLRNDTFDITFDARSFRFNAAGPVARVKMADGSNPINITADLTTIPPPSETTHDCVNSDVIDGTRLYRFQAGGVTIGGTGVNVDYTFEAFSNTNTMYSDVKNVVAGIASSSVGFYGQNFRFTNPQPGSYTLNGNTYQGNGFYTPNMSPYLESLYKGYQHTETYRFGITFYNKQGDASFVKWIGDIECPRVHDTNGAAAAVNFSHTGYDGGLDFAYNKILHPIFTVRLGSLSAADKAKLSGFSIVRVNRNGTDRTILYSGILHPIEYDGIGTRTFLPNVSNAAPDSTYGNIGNAEMTLSTGAPAINQVDRCTLTTPDHLLGSYAAYQAGDKLDIVSVLTPPTANWAAQQITAGNTGFVYEKLYTSTTVTAGTMAVVNAGVEIALNGTIDIQKASTSNTTLATPFDNTTYQPAAVNRHSVGDKTMLLELASGIDYTANGLTRLVAGKFYAYYKRPNTNQYGGRSITQRSLSEYMTCQHFQSTTDPNTIGTYTVSLFGGDTYTSNMETQRYLKNWNDVGGATGANSKMSYIVYFPVECQRNPEWRSGITVNRTGLPDSGTSTDLGEDFLLNSGLYNSIDNPIQKYYPKPAVFNSTDEWDNRVAYSQIKINGETTDSWSNFKTNDYWDVEGDKGPINNIDIFNAQMMLFQDRAFGTLLINPVSQIQDVTGTSIMLGTGDVIQRHNYVSTEAGSKHQFGMARSASAYVFYDVIKKRLWKYTQSEGLQPLSDVKGLEAFFAENTKGEIYNYDNPVGTQTTTTTIVGICATYDYRFNQFLFTFKDYTGAVLGESGTGVPNYFTVSYNEEFDCFESFYDYYPSVYINDGINILTRDPSNVNTLYVHNLGNSGSYYGTVYPAYITLISNAYPKQTKAFDNMEWQTECKDTTGVEQWYETFDKIRCYDDYQNTDYQVLTYNTNLKRPERNWQCKTPANVVKNITTNSLDIFNTANFDVTRLFKDRMRDKYLTVDLITTNVNNRQLICHWFNMDYRVSIR